MNIPPNVFNRILNEEVTDLDLAYLCEIIYYPKEEIQERIPSNLKMRFYDDIETDTQAMLIQTKSQLILVFRGTEKIQDWLENIKTYLKSFVLETESIKQQVGRIHAGFLTCWGGTYQKPFWWVLKSWGRRRREVDVPGIRDNIFKNFPNNNEYKSIIITGHSLGGAIGSVAAVNLIAEGYPVSMLVTFGSPRVGNHIWRNHAEQMIPTIRRYVNRGDIVPVVPALFLPFQPWRRYRHAGVLYYITQTHLSDAASPVLLIGLKFWELQRERVLNFIDVIRLRLVSLIQYGKWLEMSFSPLAHHEITQYIGTLRLLLQYKDDDTRQADESD